MHNTAQLKQCLDTLAEQYDAAYIDSDPVELIHRYTKPGDCEIAGLIVSSLAYGGAPRIRKSSADVLMKTGASLTDFTRNLTPKQAFATFAGFKHRWTTGEHIAALFLAIRSILEQHDSIGAFIRSLDDPTKKTIENVMVRFSNRINEQCGAVSEKSPADETSHILSPRLKTGAPANGSPCISVGWFAGRTMSISDYGNSSIPHGLLCR